MRHSPVKLIGLVAAGLGASAAVGYVLGGGFGLVSGLLGGTWFTLWLAFVGASLGALAGASSFAGGAGVFAIAGAMRVPLSTARMLASLAAGSAGAAVVWFTAGGVIVNALAITSAIYLIAAIIAWLTFPLLQDMCAKLGRTAHTSA